MLVAALILVAGVFVGGYALASPGPTHLKVAQILTDPRARLTQPRTGNGVFYPPSVQPRPPVQPPTGFGYCVNSTTGKRAPCSPPTPSSRIGNGVFYPPSVQPRSPVHPGAGR